MLKVLTPIKLACEILEVSKNPSICFAIPIISQLREILTQQKEHCFKDEIEFLLDDMNERWNTLSFELLIPTFLDLRFKTFDFLGINRTEIFDKVVNLLEKQIAEVKVSVDDDKKKEISKLSIFFGQQNNELDKSTTELEKYIQEKPKSKEDKFDNLQWWKENEKNYPNLSRIAQNYLSIPASSAPVEGLFSRAGDVITKRRNSLNPDIINSLMVVKEFWN